MPELERSLIMSALLDVLSVLILLICIWSAARKGFVKTLVDFAGTLVALVSGWHFGPHVAELLEKQYIGPFFERAVNKYLLSYMSGVGDSASAFAEQFNSLLADMPPMLESYFARFSVSPEQVKAGFESAATGSARQATLSTIATPFAHAVSAAAGFLLVFLGVLLAIKLLTIVADLVMKLPVLKSFNHGFGALLGAVQGILIVLIFAGLVTYLAPYLQNYMGKTFDAGTIGSTLVFKYFYQFSPFKKLL
ncbi:MAG: CvpA family protein [Clostridia bacterium]|nr:CvpA family protein [Clostridia bacterium]